MLRLSLDFESLTRFAVPLDERPLLPSHIANDLWTLLARPTAPPHPGRATTVRALGSVYDQFGHGKSGSSVAKPLTPTSRKHDRRPPSSDAGLEISSRERRFSAIICGV